MNHKVFFSFYRHKNENKNTKTMFFNTIQSRFDRCFLFFQKDYPKQPNGYRKAEKDHIPWGTYRVSHFDINHPLACEAVQDNHHQVVSEVDKNVYPQRASVIEHIAQDKSQHKSRKECEHFAVE